jgi:hypothetical protein
MPLLHFAIIDNNQMFLWQYFNIEENKSVFILLNDKTPTARPGYTH